MATVPRVRSLRRGGVTFEEFCARSPDGQKADLIDGEIFVASPDNFDANKLSVWLLGLMSGYAQKRKLGQVVGLRVAFRLDDHNAPEPDIALVRTENAARIHRGYVEGPPDLAVEIISPDSIERDYEKKYLQYQRFGVPEYWILDEELQSIRLFILGPRRKFREMQPREGTYLSQALPGFRLDPAWFWQGPLPDLFDTLQELLGAGGP